MARLLLIFLSGWMALSTVLGLFLGRVIAAHHNVEASTDSAPREHSRHAA
jgi:hypothetical protein